MKQKEPVSVLVAPLDWGLGHATRCIPVINELIQQGARVLIAASGSQKALLNQEFPQLQFLEIPGYKISYKRGILLKWALILRAPYFLRQIKEENKWLEQTLRDHTIQIVISDNRYGLYNKSLFTVFITHQLAIQSGIGAYARTGGLRSAIDGWVDRLFLKWNYKFIEKYSCCWVPDLEIFDSLGGRLSHPALLPKIPLKYIGILSRFKYRENIHRRNYLLILLSGPEPQRTRFENILCKQLSGMDLQALVVRGLPDNADSMPSLREGIVFVNHLSTDILNEKILEAEYIIARSGYSTIMDLARLKRSAILVPTPGQTEQEYLGFYLNEKKWMYAVSQKKFDLVKSLMEFTKLKMTAPDIREAGLKDFVGDLLNSHIKK